MIRVMVAVFSLALIISIQGAYATEMDYNAIINRIAEAKINPEDVNALINIENLPEEVKGVIGNEKINIYIEGIDKPLYVELSDGKIVDVGIGAREEATMQIDTDVETLEVIAKGQKTFQDALKDRSIRYGGLGILNAIKFAFINFLMWLAGLFGLI